MSERDLPTRGKALVFATKVRFLRLKRASHNAIVPLSRHAPGRIQGALIISSHESELWTEAAPEEQRLQLGKVQNLRIACNSIDGIVIPAGETFSFWKQLGYPAKSKGYVPGRQIQEGCVIPATAGGICQLSNALYSCALDAGFEIVERHPHTRALPRTSGSYGKDATVAWNHIDLRFRSDDEFRIDAKLTNSKLVVRFLAASKRATVERSRLRIQPRVIQAESCETCGQADCFRHSFVDRSAVENATAWVLGQTWPEFRVWLQSNWKQGDVALMPIDGSRRGRKNYDWGVEAVDTPLLFAKRRLACLGLEAAKLREKILNYDRKFAGALGRRMPIEARHVVVSLSLLPHLWRRGWLGGRTFDVLADRLPIAWTHELLDNAFKEHPDRKLLGDFRAPQEDIVAESEALTAAENVITSNAFVANRIGEKGRIVPWSLPPTRSIKTGKRVAFPGPTAARKGAYELREAARALGLTIVLLGSELEGNDFWEGVEVVRPGTHEDWLEGCCCVVQPAIVEERPRHLLEAIACGVPVIATDVCGIRGMAGVTITEPTVDALVADLARATARSV